jgi:hypothetical protein
MVITKKHFLEFRFSFGHNIESLIVVSDKNEHVNMVFLEINAKTEKNVLFQ